MSGSLFDNAATAQAVGGGIRPTWMNTESNPLAVVKQVQDLRNAQATNALTQQTTANAVLANQQGQVDLGNSSQMAIAKAIISLKAIPSDQLTSGTIQQAIQSAGDAGHINPAITKAWSDNLTAVPTGADGKPTTAGAFGPLLDHALLYTANPDLAARLTQPSQGPDVNLPGGGLQGTSRAPAIGSSTPYAITPTGAAVAQGPTPDTASQISTITGADGIPHTDSLAGHIRSGRVAPSGQLAPGYTTTQGPAVPSGAYGTSGPAASIKVPQQYMPFFQEASARTGIPVETLIAQARQESAFNPNATGAAGEIGIGQIKPSTAADPGYGLKPVDPASLRDPRTNINFAADYLKAKAGGGNMSDPAVQRAALAAYNGGGDPNYVANVTRYLPVPSVQPPSATQPSPTGSQPVVQPTAQTPAQPAQSGTAGPAPGVVANILDQQNADKKTYHDATVNYNNNDANLIANYKEAYNLGTKLTATGQGSAAPADLRARIVTLGNSLGVPTGAMGTSDQARAELDKVLNQILVNQPGATRSDAGQATAGASQPHLGMNTAGMMNQIRILYGQAKQQNAAMLEADPKTQGIGYEEANRGMLRGTAREGFASDLMTSQEIDAKIKSLGGATAPAARAFLKAQTKNLSIYQGTTASSLEQ